VGFIKQNDLELITAIFVRFKHDQLLLHADCESGPLSVRRSAELTKLIGALANQSIWDLQPHGQQGSQGQTSA
jgi:hypothetical protein